MILLPHPRAHADANTHHYMQTDISKSVSQSDFHAAAVDYSPRQESQDWSAADTEQQCTRGLLTESASTVPGSSAARRRITEIINGNMATLPTQDTQCNQHHTY